MQYKNYLISLNPVTKQWELLSTNYIFFDPIDIETLAANIDPDIIRAAIYHLLESLKEKENIDGRNRAFGREQSDDT